MLRRWSFLIHPQLPLAKFVVCAKLMLIFLLHKLQPRNLMGLAWLHAQIRHLKQLHAVPFPQLRDIGEVVEDSELPKCRSTVYSYHILKSRSIASVQARAFLVLGDPHMRFVQWNLIDRQHMEARLCLPTDAQQTGRKISKAAS